MSTIHVGHIRNAVTNRFTSLIDLSDLKPTLPSEERENHFLTRGLAAFAIAELASVDDATAASSVVDGTNDNGLDAFYFDHEDRICYLVQSKWNKNGNKSIELGEMLKFIQGVRDLIDLRLDRFGKLQKHKVDVDYALTDITAKFVLVIVYTGEPALAEPVQRPLDELLHSLNDINISFSYRILRQAELHAIVAKQAQGQSIDFSIMLYEWGTVDEPYRAFYGQVALEDIAKWGAYGQSLFAQNLRGFKGNTEVNESIINTMRQSPQNFWYFNNGVTVLCNKIAKQHLGGNNRTSGVFECEGASVVNGAQTVGSIIQASSIGENGFHHARVLVRLISLETCPPQFSSDITRAANTQNRIEKKDFAALDATQSRLRTELFSDFEKEYAYKTGDRVPSPSEGCTLDEAAVALACAQDDVALVVFAKAAPGRLYDDVGQPPYTVLFNPSVTAGRLWRSIEVLRIVDSSLKVAQGELEGKERLIAVHGNRFVLYMVFRSIFHLAQGGEEFESERKQVAEMATDVLKRVIVEANRLFPSTYAGNLFKNITKCRELAEDMNAHKISINETA